MSHLSVPLDDTIFFEVFFTPDCVSCSSFLLSAPLGWNLGPSSVCVLYYSKNTVLTALHWSLQQPFLTGCAVCNSNPCSPALAVPRTAGCARAPYPSAGGAGGGRGVSAPHPDSCTCVDAFICPLRQHILRELVQLPHALRRLDYDGRNRVF